MTVYQKPIYYLISHVLIGVIAAYYGWVGIAAIGYQLTQLIFNVRFFPVEWKIMQGNSIEHTAVKLTEILLGYAIGNAIKYYS